MNRRQKIIVSVTGIFLVLLLLVGLTYAYFLTKITGNENTKSISVTTATLSLTYGNDDGSIIGDGELIEPNTTFKTKTFTVTNTGNETIKDYAVVLENLNIINLSTGNPTTLGVTGQRKNEGKENDFDLVITCKDQNGNDCNGYEDVLPEENKILLTNSINPDDVHTYSAVLTYVDTEDDQSDDMNKKITGKFNIIDTKNTADIEGTVTNKNGELYYVQTNSTKRISGIDSTGKYKVMGLEAGTHTLKLCKKKTNVSDADDNCSEPVLTREITIKKGETASGNNSTNTITVKDKFRLASINIDATSKTSIINEKIEELEIELGGDKQYKEGSLAYQIINNAVTVTSAEKEDGYAEYRATPLTIPAVEATMTYADNGAGTESTKNYVSTKTFTTTNAAKYYITYGDTYSYTTNYTITNKDGSALKAVLVSTGYETLKGKYIVSYSGSTKATAVSGSGKSTIYYVTNATATTLDYIQLNGGLASNEKYITYGDSYKFDKSTGTYTLQNVQVVKYNDGYKTLVGKYIVDTSGTNVSTPAAATNKSSIYLVTGNSTETKMTYKTVTKKTTEDSYGSAESTLTTTPDEYGTSYYFRGSVKNNYVEFNGMCWRIVRIEGDGSIKITLAAQKQCSQITSADTGSAFIGTGDYGYDDSYYADYENSKNRTSSMKYKFNEWFTTNLASVSSKLKTTTACIGDTTTKYNSNGAITTSTYEYNFDSYVRLKGIGQIANATLMCGANGKKTSATQIFPLTADEVVFAGGKAGSANYSYYLRDNASANSWWTLSPSSFRVGDEYGDLSNSFRVNGNGYVDDGYYVGGGDGSLRPAVSLAAGVKIATGDGTKDSPYTIQ